MAKTLKPGAGGDDSDGRVTEKHNVAAREAIIQETYQKYSRLQTEIAEALEEHVQPMKDELGKLMKNAKTNTGIPIAVFKAQFKLIEMANKAELDEDETATTIDDIREVFQALRKGGQLNFLNVVDGAPNLGPDGPYGNSYKAGHTVGMASGERDGGGHLDGSVERDAWLAGYDAAADERAGKTDKAA